MNVLDLPVSHVHEGISLEQRGYALSMVVLNPTVELPEELGTVPCNLYGPSVGDPPTNDGDWISWRIRKPRGYVSRTIQGKRVKQTRLITLIVGPYEGSPHILYEMFGGPLAPKELLDPSLTKEEFEEAKAFWSVHALIP
jgi:hypothetical protein